jgi:hypothetical protein
VYGGGVRYFTPDESYYRSEGGTASDVDAAEIEEEEEELEEESEGYAHKEEDSEVYAPEEELDDEEEDEHRGLAEDDGDSEGGSCDSLGNITLPYYMGSTFCGVETVHSNSTIVSFAVDGGMVGAPRRGDRVVGDTEAKKKKTKKAKKATRLDERARAVVGRGGRGRGHIPEITPEKR